MTMVAEISWDAMAAPDFESPARRAWREAVATIAAKAKETLPQCNGRVDRAVQIVLAGDVQRLDDGQFKVASQSSGTVVYHLVNGGCTCKDYEKAPSNWCKHRIAAGLYQRATALMLRQLTPDNGQAAPEAPPAPAAAAVSTPAELVADTPAGIPQQHIVLIQGRPFVRYAGLLQLAHSKGLLSLTADWTYNDSELSIAHAVAVFQDGRRFEESGDATPANVGKKVALHWRRLALTRSKARVLRDALGVDLVAVEELGEE